MKHIDASGQTFECPTTFNGAVTFNSTVTFAGAVAQTGDSAITGSQTISADLTVGDDLAVTGDLSVGGAVDLSGADSITLPTGMAMVRTWTSGSVTQASLVGGATSQSINLPAGAQGAFPSAVQVLGAYLETTGSVTTTGGDTTTVACALGVSGSPTSYLAAGADLVGGAVAKKENATGTLIGSYRAADTPQLYVSAGGGDPDVADITALSVRAVITYRTTT